MNTFGQHLKKLRTNAGYTQNALAQHLGIEQSSLSYLENDRTAPNEEIFNKILTIFQCSAKDLLDALDQEYVRKHLSHLPVVAKGQLHIAQKKSTAVLYDRFYLSISGSLILGIALFLLGILGIIQSNHLFHYQATVIYSINTPLPNGGYRGFSKEITEYFKSPSYLGEFHVKPRATNNEPIRNFSLVQMETKYTVLNKLFIISGVIINLIIIILLGFEKRMRQLWHTR